MKKLISFAGSLLVVGCCSDTRFTHVDVDGPAPYVFFDQKTKQMCWAGSESGEGKTVTVIVKVRSKIGDNDTNPVLTTMPVCKDLK